MSCCFSPGRHSTSGHGCGSGCRKRATLRITSGPRSCAMRSNGWISSSSRRRWKSSAVATPTRSVSPAAAAKLVELADQNARHLLDSFKIETFDIDERAADPVFALGRDLGLPVVPRAMVCIDISTNQGRDTVGSLVWFEGGRPRKAEYRRYRIKGVEGIDDFAAMKEVVTRFLTRRIAEHKQIPDLIVIDGGKGQLAAAVEAARALGQDRLPIVSLAKREEEVFLQDSGEPLRL